MKKGIVLLLFIAVASYCNAQLFKSKAEYDSIGDVLYYKECRLHLTKSDSTLVIAEEGKDPVVFQMFLVEPTSLGSQDSLMIDEEKNRGYYGFAYITKDYNDNIKVIVEKFYSKSLTVFEYGYHSFSIYDAILKDYDIVIGEKRIVYQSDYLPELEAHVKSIVSKRNNQ